MISCSHDSWGGLIVIEYTFSIKFILLRNEIQLNGLQNILKEAILCLIYYVEDFSILFEW